MFNRTIGKVWANICKYEGEDFFTVRGKSYKYTVKDNYIVVNDDHRRKIKREYFEKALLLKNPSPSTIQQEGIWGPSYVYGIITDKRIK